MCGIFGIITKNNNASQVVFRGLSDIEYRGYDSWGVASVVDSQFEVKKEIGFLPKAVKFRSSTLSIGHTRWATHGGVTRENAHPHLDCTGKIALVHNGIVENYQKLKEHLSGHTFKSQTDTEVIVHLIEHQLKKDASFSKAVAEIFNKLEGLNAVVVTDGQQIVACKNSSPLVVGQTKDGFVIASDPNALLSLTNQLLFLEDYQMVVLDKEITLYNLPKMTKLTPKFIAVPWEYKSSTLKNYPHFMIKEIEEQPQVFRNLLQDTSEIEKTAKDIKKSYGVYFIGCGTAGYACLLGVYLFSKIAKRHVNFSIGSEFNYIQDYLTKDSLLIAISQSGETIDILEPVSLAKKRQTQITAITNTLGSSLYRLAGKKILLQAGPEKAVASTKAYTAMQAVVIMLAYSLINQAKEGVKVIEQSTLEVEKILANQKIVADLAEKIHLAQHIYVLGRGLSYPIALESSLKIKETSYIHAEGFASGELKHGALALIEKDTPVIVYCPNDETKEAVLANAMEVKSRGAFVIGVSDKNNTAFDYFFEVKDVGASSVIPNVVFAQLLGYHLSVKKKINPDKPRNLAKSVVVR